MHIIYFKMFLNHLICGPSAIPEEGFHKAEKEISDEVLKKFDETQKMGSLEIADQYRMKLTVAMTKQGATLEKANNQKLDVKRLQDKWRDTYKQVADELKEMKKSYEEKGDLTNELLQKLQQEIGDKQKCMVTWRNHWTCSIPK